MLASSRARAERRQADRQAGRRAGRQAGRQAGRPMGREDEAGRSEARCANIFCEVETTARP